MSDEVMPLDRHVTSTIVTDAAPRKRRRRPAKERKTRRRLIWRLELACGHTAFALAAEAHVEGGLRFCHVCDQFAEVASSSSTEFKVPDVPSRMAIKHHEPE